MRRLAVLALLAVVLLPVPPASARAELPSEDVWLADVRDAMAGSRAYVGDRVAKPGGPFAVNFDIDNTALATHYDEGRAVRVVLRFARYAHRHGVKLFFNTARVRPRSLEARGELEAAGYVVDEVCSRVRGETIAEGKRRCRRHFVREGFTIIANVGNRRTDFVGGSYERAFRLPNYHNALG